MISHQQVRQALRVFHSECKFAETEVARRLSVAYPGQSVRNTFVSAVSSAFDCAATPDALELRDLILTNDIESIVPRNVAAKRCNTSYALTIANGAAPSAA